MYGAKKRKICMRSFEMPHESALVESVYNNKTAKILSEQIFQDRAGTITVLLKYEIDDEGVTTTRSREERQVNDLD